MYLFKRGQAEHILTMANSKLKPSLFTPRPIMQKLLLNWINVFCLPFISPFITIAHFWLTMYTRTKHIDVTDNLSSYIECGYIHLFCLRRLSSNTQAGVTSKLFSGKNKWFSFKEGSANEDNRRLSKKWYDSFFPPDLYLTL